MAQPRPVHSGPTYLITRRCSQRTFRLRPHAETNQAFEYCLALAAERTSVRIHGVVVMSNHHHLVVTNVKGNLPDFLRELHRASAKVLNASQGQWENLWAVEQTSAVVLAKYPLAEPPSPVDLPRKRWSRSEGSADFVR